MEVLDWNGGSGVVFVSFVMVVAVLGGDASVTWASVSEEVFRLVASVGRHGWMFLSVCGGEREEALA